MLINRIIPGAWKLTEAAPTPIYALHVPTTWRQVAQTLNQQRARSGYRSIPVRSLDSIIGTTFPQIISTNRKSWWG